MKYEKKKRLLPRHACVRFVSFNSSGFTRHMCTEGICSFYKSKGQIKKRICQLPAKFEVFCS